MAKRLLDILFALVAIVLTMPIIAIACLLIWAQDGRSPVYAGLRVGRFNRDFRMFKLRTMIPDAHRSGGPSTSASDGRLTPLGSALRRFKLDELPQFWNVLKGDMSMVGPRPNVREAESIATRSKSSNSFRSGLGLPISHRSFSLTKARS